MRIRISVKGASRKKPAIVQKTAEYPDRAMTVEEFLTETVRQEVRAFNDRRESSGLLRLLSPDEMDAMAAAGKVSVGRPDDDRTADEAKAAANALQCFEDGIAAVFADGKRYTQRGEVMDLHEDSEVTFVRLTFLAGRMW